MAKRKTDITEAEQSTAEVQEQENVQVTLEASVEEIKAPEQAEESAAPEAPASEDNAPEPEPEVPADETETTESSAEQAEGGEAPEQAEEPAAPEAPTDKAEAVQDDAKFAAIPENALKVLKLYPDEPKLYVNKYGGAFSIDTPTAVRGGAVLYDNPFYNS